MKHLGQHFLRNHSAIKKIAAALELKEGDVVVEIGSGHGELTNELINHPIEVTAIERDKNLAKTLESNVKSQRLKVIEGDILKLLPQLTYNLQPITYKLVGNIPYYLTGYLLRLIGELEYKPSLIVFTLQKEVAERIAAKPPKMNKLAASVQFWAEPAIIDYLQPADFSPPPKVHSAIIRLRPKPHTLNPKPYYQMINLLFKQPRKTIKNNLRGTGLENHFKTLNLTGQERPQDLDLEKLIQLSQFIKL